MASLREEMPQVAAWADELRAVFCETSEDLASFNRNIRAGMEGQPTFWASENGRTVGARDTRKGITPVIRSKAEQEAENKLRGRR